MILGNENVREEIEFQLSLLRLLTEPHGGKLGVRPETAEETVKLERMAQLAPDRS